MSSGKPRSVGVRVSLCRCNYCGEHVVTLDHPDGGPCLAEKSHPCPGNVGIVRVIRWDADDLARLGLHMRRSR